MERRGYQFLHIEGYARKIDAKGRSIDYVLSEAERRPESCQHVDKPCPPEQVYGASLADLRALHDNRAATATVTIAGGKIRRIRTDQLTLMTVVASHPATVADVQDSPVIAAQVEAWEQHVIAWLKEEWGGALAAVVRHVDEKHAHLHAYILPEDADMRARRLHPGVSAKEATKEATLAGGNNAKIANAAGDKAYCDAMRAMQDRFWVSVGIPCALTRIGPGRRRLTRAEWHSEKTGIAAAAVAFRAAELARKEVAAMTDATDQQRVIAESIEARARAATGRAHAAITTARVQTIEAKAAIVEVQAERAEAERQALLFAARGRRFVKQARAEAHRILESAQEEAQRVRRRAVGIGAWFGALVHGLRGAAPGVVARQAAAAARAEEQALSGARASLARAESERLRTDLQQAETRLVAIADAAAGLGEQRDRLARELNRLRPISSMKPTPMPHHI